MAGLEDGLAARCLADDPAILGSPRIRCGMTAAPVGLFTSRCPKVPRLLCPRPSGIDQFAQREPGMGRVSLVRRARFAVLLLSCPLLTGCFAVPVVLPTASYVPGVKVEAPPEEVRAFRVDVADDLQIWDIEEKDRYVLRPIPVSESGHVSPQASVACDRGGVLGCVAMYYWMYRHHTLRVRLYRPGWQTVEIKPWEIPERVTWKEATDLASREKALDDLLSTWDTDGTGQLSVGAHEQLTDPSRYPPPPQPPDLIVFRNLAPGSTSAEHRQLLLFTASEYERLATSAVSSVEEQEFRARLTAKAN